MFRKINDLRASTFLFSVICDRAQNTARTLFGVEQLPCDNQVRNLLDPLSPRALDGVFVEVCEGLERHGALANFRGLNDQLLIAMDGTQYYASTTMHGKNCLTRQTSAGPTLYYHTAITPVIVCPGRTEVIALAPEYLMPQDGHDKQDCERAAGKRWLVKHAASLAPHGITVLGDDLYSNQPLCALALQNGCHFLFVCKPDSHASLSKRLAFWQDSGASKTLERRRRNGRFTEVTHYRSINDVGLRGGRDALSVHWLEITVVHAKTGEQRYDNSFITNHQLMAVSIAEVAQAGRGRWKNETSPQQAAGYQKEGHWR